MGDTPRETQVDWQYGEPPLAAVGFYWCSCVHPEGGTWTEKLFWSGSRWTRTDLYPYPIYAWAPLPAPAPRREET